MTDRLVNLSSGELLAGGVADERGWLELSAPEGDDGLRISLTEDELLSAVEALSMILAEVVGAPPNSVGRGVRRVLGNRVRAARERQGLQELLDDWVRS